VVPFEPDVAGIYVLFEQTSVGEFLQQTLTCQAETPIQEILDLLQHPSESTASLVIPADIESVACGANSSQLVVVNNQQQPLSLIPLSQFIRLFLTEQQSVLALSPQQPIAAWINLYSCPLQCVPETYSLKQFWQYLQTFSQNISLSWAIVEDTTGQYRGLLDTTRLIQFLAQQTPLSVAIKFSSDLKSRVSPLELSDHPPAWPESSSSPETTPLDGVLSAELLAEISHELKSPLTAVLSLSNVLSHQGIQTLSERQLEYVQLIHQKSQQLMGIVNNLQDLTQLHTHDQPESRNAVDLDLLCADAIAQAKRYYLLEQGTANTHSLTIQCDSSTHLGILFTNELKLRQILVYLLHNSLGLTRGLSTIELSVKRWQGWVIFTITDQGIPIPYQQQPLIFQSPQTWTHPDLDHFGKTGLGLILAAGLAEQIFGSVSFISGPDQNNTFSVYIPTESTRRNLARKGTRELVLIIATDPTLIDQLNQHLSNRSVQAIIARSEQEALQKLKIFKPEAVILQTTLTTASGWDVLALLRKQDSARPILLVGDDADCKRASKMEGQICSTLATLGQKLEQWLEQGLGNPQPSSTANTHTIDPDQLSASRPDSPQSQKLTVLHLDSNLEKADSILPLDINTSLHGYQWRVLSTTTLEEAELLVNVWKPNVVLYTAKTPEIFVEMTADSPLTQYPFIILHPDVQHIARERGDLKIFTNANSTTLQSAPELTEVSSLLQILNNITTTTE